ncbi:MAG TPA: hypothetical protein VF954_02070 [Acidimicrobiales bacterium]
MTVSDLLDGAFKLYKANFGSILVVDLVFVAPFQLAAAFAQRNTFGGQSFLRVFSSPSTLSAQRGSSPGSTIARGVVLLLDLLLVPFVAGAISRIVGASYLGQEISAGPALRATARRWLSLLAAWVMIHLMELGGLVMGLLFVGVAVAFSGPGRVIGVLVAVGAFLVSGPVALAVMALSVMVAPAIVAEDLGPIRGIRRSWRLVRRRFWPVLGTALLAGFMASILGSVIGAGPQIAAFGIGLKWGWIILGAGSVVVSALTLPIVAITATLLYFDARIRTEGFDLQVLAMNLASPIQRPIQPPFQPPSRPPTSPVG